MFTLTQVHMCRLLWLFTSLTKQAPAMQPLLKDMQKPDGWQAGKSAGKQGVPVSCVTMKGGTFVSAPWWSVPQQLTIQAGPAGAQGMSGSL